MPEPASASDDTDRLIALVIRRDEAAARALVERLGPTIARIVNSYPRLKPDAEDLLQDVFFRIFRALPKFRGEAPLEHWASRVARFACIDQLRRLKARPEDPISHLSPAQAEFLGNLAATTPSASAADAACGLLDHLLSRLKPIDEWLLRQIELHQRPIADVAEEAGWNVNLTHVRLFRARHRLRRAYETLEPPTP